MSSRNIEICNECNSDYYASASEMMKLCPNCSHYLYRYANCDHNFKNGRCIKCYWNGLNSEFIKQLDKK